MKLLELIHASHDVELSKQQGMVFQVWHDGEITLQKSGELLWQRNLHCMESGFYHGIKAEQMPMQCGHNGYAFVTRDNAYKIRAAMREDEAGLAY